MTNSDSAFGTFNKQTKIISQISDGSTALTVFANVDAAKSHFFTDSAITVMDECCTILQWALQADGNGDNTQLKTTFAFGTKGSPTIAEADDWAGQYNSRKTALKDAHNWTKVACTFTDDSNHLV